MLCPLPRRSSRLNAIKACAEHSTPPKPTSQKRKIIIITSDTEYSDTPAPISTSKKPKRTHPNVTTSPLKTQKVKMENSKTLRKLVNLKPILQVKVVMKDKCVGTEDSEVERVETKSVKEDALDLINSAFMDDMCCSLCLEIFVNPISFGTCGHTFCGTCVRTWLKQQSSCPECRSPVQDTDIFPNRGFNRFIQKFADIFLSENDLKERIGRQECEEKRVIQLRREYN